MPASFLTNSGIPICIDERHAIARNKIILIDRTAIITGSFDFTKAAEGKTQYTRLQIQSVRVSDWDGSLNAF